MPFNFNPEAAPFQPCAPKQQQQQQQEQQPESRAQQRPAPDPASPTSPAQEQNRLDARRNWNAAPAASPAAACVHGRDEFPPLGAPCSAKAPKAAPRLLPARKSLLTEQLAALAVREHEGKVR